MAGSRAAGAREPGQIREEAALSDTARAPRISLAGANDRRARPGAGFKGGCTVHLLGMDNVAVIRQVVERWNAGDHAGVSELYADDIVMVAAREWPDTARSVGKEAMERSTQEFRSAWESSEIDMDRLESVGDLVVAQGAWDSRGLASGATGRLPFGIIFTLRDGLITRLEWFMDPEEARAAAGLA
jgi:ketosteroid isomerase-like protein